MLFRRRRRPDAEAENYLHYLERLTANTEWAHGYETLVTNLSARREGRLGSLLITSTQPAEGKTTIATNLGMALAIAGKRVLLVDADFRRPAFDTIFSGAAAAEERQNGAGLADLLDGRRSENDVVRYVPLPTGSGGGETQVGVVATGRLASRRFAALDSSKLDAALATWTKDTDIVVIDSPPVLAVSDALLIAPKVDGVLLVVAAGSCGERELRRTKASLEAAGGKLIGLVLNRFDDKAGPAYHPYSRYYADPE